MVTLARQQAQQNSGVSGISYGGASQASPSQVSNAVSTSLGYTPNAVSTNPHDAPGYNPATDKTSSAYDPNATNTPVDTSQPSPQKANATPTTEAVQNNTNPTNTAQAMPSGLPRAADLTGDTASQAGQAIDQLKAKYGKALTDLTGSGVAAPSGQGSANAGLKSALDSQPKPAPEVPESVKSFMDPATNPILDEQTQKLREFLSPEADRVALNDSIAQLQTDRSTLNGLKVELMNVKNIMAGSQQDIADEVTKAGGTISASLLANMTLARNRTLIARGQQLTDQIQSAADIVASDVSLVGDEKQLAQQQFTQNMSLLQFQQTNQQNQLNAARDSIKMLLGPNMENAQAVYNSVKDTAYESRYEQVLGLPKDGMAQLAAIQSTQATKDALTIQGLKLDNAKKVADLAGGTSDKVQQGLEKDFKDTLLKEFSSRSGTYGLNDAKVSAANKLAVLFNQGYDEKTGNYTINKQNYGELAVGLANLIAGSTGASEATIESLKADTAKGDIGKLYTYLTGAPAQGTSQQILNSMAQTIEREAKQAAADRQVDEDKLIGLAPTDLDPARRDALIKAQSIQYTGIKGQDKDKPVDGIQRLLQPLEIPSGFYQASDGLLYKK